MSVNKALTHCSSTQASHNWIALLSKLCHDLSSNNVRTRRLQLGSRFCTLPKVATMWRGHIRLGQNRLAVFQGRNYDVGGKSKTESTQREKALRLCLRPSTTLAQRPLPHRQHAVTCVSQLAPSYLYSPHSLVPNAPNCL
jgi:hypothetical protein